MPSPTTVPNRYTSLHTNTEGPGDKRPTAIQIVKDEDALDRLTDKLFVVTGISSGIGIDTLGALYATGAHVIGTVRNLDKGRKVVSDIEDKGVDGVKGGKITLVEMDLESFASVRKGAEEILRVSGGKVNGLVNNAGVMATPEGKTKDGFETQFGTNHLAHFLLFQLLKPALLSSATPAFPSRVVSLTSFGHRMSSVRFQDYNFAEKNSYVPWVAYGQSKTANIYFANHLERLYGSRNLHATSVHPGGIETGLQVHVPEINTLTQDPKVKAYMKSPEQGAATSVYALLGSEWKDKGGKYLADCQEMGPFVSEDLMTTGDDGHATWAYDPEAEARLWKESLEMVQMKGEEA